MTRILVINDNEKNRLELSQTLQSAGFDVEAVSSVEAIYRKPADVAMIDIMLHCTTGFEVTRKLMALNPSLRVVLLGDERVHPFPLAKLECECECEFGSIAYVSRPCAIDDLIECIRQSLAIQENVA